MKKTALIVFAVLAFVLGAGIVIPSLIDWSRYKEPVIRMIQESTGYKVTLSGPVQARVLPFPFFDLHDVAVYLPEKAEPVFKVARLSASLDLFSVLTGHIRIGTIHLIKPDILLDRLENGHLDVPSILVQKLKGQKTDDQKQRTSVSVQEDSKNQAVFFSGASIKNGRVRIKDIKTGNQYIIDNLDSDVSFGGLYGPYHVKSEGRYNGLSFDVRGSVGDLGDSGADVPLRIDGRFPDHTVSVLLEGTVSRRAGGNVQGMLHIKGAHLFDLVRDLGMKTGYLPKTSIEMTTQFSATPRNIVFDRIEFLQGKTQTTGTVKVRLPDVNFSRPFVEARLKNPNIVDAREMIRFFEPSKIQGKNLKKTESKNIQELQANKTVQKIKSPIDLDIEWIADGIQLGDSPIKDIMMKITSEKGQMRGRIQAGSLPGSGQADITIYSGLNDWILANGIVHMDDPVRFIKEGLGIAPPAIISSGHLRDLKIKTEIQFAPNGNVRAESGTASWRGGELIFGGSEYESRKGQKPLVILDLSGALLDLGAWIPPKTETKNQKIDISEENIPLIDIKEKARQAAVFSTFPVDLKVRSSFKEIKIADYALNGFSLSGRIIEKTGRIDILKIDNIDGVSIDLRGAIQDMQKLEGIDFSLVLAAVDGKAVTQKFAPQYAGKWIKTSPVKINMNYKGSLEQAQIDFKGRALGLGLAAMGDVNDPFEKVSFESLRMTIDADQVRDALNFIQPGLNATEQLRGPLHVSGITTVKESVYRVENLSGNVGMITIKGDLRADFSRERPKISGGLHLGDVPLDALMGVHRNPRTGGGGDVSSEKTTKNLSNTGSGWSQDSIKTNWMRAFDLDFSVTATKIIYNLWSVSNLGVSIALQNGKMTINDVGAGLFGGTLSGNGFLSAPMKESPLDISAQIQMKDVNAQSLSNALFNKNMNRIEGVLSTNLDIIGRGKTPHELVSSLTGSAGSNGRDILVNGIDVAKLVTWLSTDLKPSTTIEGLRASFMGTGATSFETHTGVYNIKNGLVMLDQMEFDGNQAQMMMIGTLDLPAWRMDTKTTLRIKSPPNVPPITFTLKGPLDKPVQSMMGDIFENYLQQQLEKQVHKLIEKKLGNKLNDLGLGGLLPPADQPVKTPVNTEVETEMNPGSSESEPISEKIEPEEILIDVLKGLSR